MEPEIMQIVKSNIWKIQIVISIMSVALIVFSIMAWYGHGVRLVEHQKNKEKIRKYEKVIAVIMIILAIYYPINITLDNIKFDVIKTTQKVVRIKSPNGIFAWLLSEYVILEDKEKCKLWNFMNGIEKNKEYEIYYGKSSKTVFYFKDVE